MCASTTAREAPEPAEQIKQAIARTARRSGQWTQAGVAVEGESLWEFLHHRDDVLRDESGATLIPLLIFDQFEEIFTLAQSDDFGRARAARFIADLADLVENRPPKELEAKLEQDDSAAERFDFARSDYRVLIALREDYLAPLEGLKAAMPSITQNRLRLAPMTGQQALAAVMQPGKRLVSEEVAAAIVRFVAGGAEIANAEVEPSLLSLICRELNDARIAQGRNEISLDLLAGSHASILSNFYERSLADQPPAVRRIIEDELLTELRLSRERRRGDVCSAASRPPALRPTRSRCWSIAGCCASRSAWTCAGSSSPTTCCAAWSRPAAICATSARRARPPSGCWPSSASASSPRGARWCARARSPACARCWRSARWWPRLFAYFSTQRAQRAERLAEQTRAEAEQARGQAEQLLGYLTDDFVRELESFGRLDVVAEFSKRQIDYFHALPPALKGARNHAQRRAGDGALRQRHRVPSAIWMPPPPTPPKRHRAARAAAPRRATLPRPRPLRWRWHTPCRRRSWTTATTRPDRPSSKRAVDLLRPLAEAPDASVAARRAYVEVLGRLGYRAGQRAISDEDAVRTEHTGHAACQRTGRPRYVEH